MIEDRPEEWSDRQVRALLDGIGVLGWAALQRRCGNRTKSAIWLKVKREFGGGGITRGSYSLSQMETETGYHATQLRRAAKALNQRWVRTANGGTYLITAEQLEECVVWLSHDYWCSSLELYGCTKCGTDTRPHRQGGLCLPCFRKMTRYARKLGLPYSAQKLVDLVHVQRTLRPKHARMLDSLQAKLSLGKLLDSESLRLLSEIDCS